VSEPNSLRIFEEAKTEALWKLGYDHAWHEAIRARGDLVPFLEVNHQINDALDGNSRNGDALRLGWVAGRVDVIDALLPDGMSINELAAFSVEERRRISSERFLSWAESRWDDWLREVFTNCFC
jgi:hypothetical protein